MREKRHNYLMGEWECSAYFIIYIKNITCQCLFDGINYKVSG